LLEVTAFVEKPGIKGVLRGILLKKLVASHKVAV